jgi:hypothetical protein
VNTTNSVVATATIVAAGKWANDETISVRIVIGGAFLAIGLSLMEQANPKLASRFALLVLTVAAFMYVPHIAYKAGLITRKPPDWEGRVMGRRPRSKEIRGV